MTLSTDKIDWDRVEKIFHKDKADIIKSWKNAPDYSLNPGTGDILKLLAAGALIGLSVFIPALPMILAPLVLEGKKYKHYRLNQVVHRLQKQKLIKIREINGQTVVEITRKGRVRALKYKLAEISIDKPKKWDRKWRIVIFDIPEKAKKARDLFRSHLKMMGFYNLQESVWVHPYPCFNQIEYLRQIYGVGINVSYILAEKIEQPEDLLDYFGLKS